jgi:hypothetical protein
MKKFLGKRGEIDTNLMCYQTIFQVELLLKNAKASHKAMRSRRPLAEVAERCSKNNGRECIDACQLS